MESPGGQAALRTPGPLLQQVAEMPGPAVIATTTAHCAILDRACDAVPGLCATADAGGRRRAIQALAEQAQDQ
eukprot:2852668-Alexandrium_andersonii.AAC.1